MKSRLFLLFILLVCSGSLFAQTAQEAQLQVKTYLDQLQYWRYGYSPEDSGVDPNASTADSVLYYNKVLVHYLAKDAANMQVLKAGWKPAEEDEITIATSDDGKVRVYSWDTETGDEMHIYNAVVQYDAGNGVKSRTLKDISVSPDSKTGPGALYPEIYTVQGSRKYYLLVYSSILSSKDARKGVRAFMIENGELADADIFQTKDVLSNKLEYTYDYYSNYDYKTMKEKQVLNMKKDKLNIPLAEAGVVNGKWNVYKFEGDRFVQE